jgi:hypothetical protein
MYDLYFMYVYNTDIYGIEEKRIGIPFFLLFSINDMKKKPLKWT